MRLVQDKDYDGEEECADWYPMATNMQHKEFYLCGEVVREFLENFGFPQREIKAIHKAKRGTLIVESDPEGEFYMEGRYLHSADENYREWLDSEAVAWFDKAGGGDREPFNIPVEV